MKIEDTLQNGPKYMDVIAAYGLDVAGGDLQVDGGGNIAVTTDGDLKFGNNRVNALHRLVQRWCSNAPTLEVLFKLVLHANTKKRNLGDEFDRVLSIAFSSPTLAARFHDINDEIGVHTFASGASAGAIMIALNNLLSRYRDDLKPTTNKWENSSPLIEGRSFGSIVAAAAANFRHHDEWARTHAPTNQQLGSIRVIADVLKQPIAADGNKHPFRHNMCPDLLAALSGGDFECLSQRFFSIAKDVAT
jgi:energy-converting hydrogenase Eha subunit A